MRRGGGGGGAGRRAGKSLNVVAYVVVSVQRSELFCTTRSKREFASSARRALRDAAARGAAAAEGRDVPWVGDDGPALRMSVDEGETLDTAATAAMAHMALTLHEEYRFTDACATDGSRIPRPAGARAGTVHGSARVAWGVFRGVGRTRGGALAAGASVQDAEMEAIRRCLRWVAEEAVQDGGLVQRRVLVLGGQYRGPAGHRGGVADGDGRGIPAAEQAGHDGRHHQAAA